MQAQHARIPIDQIIDPEDGDKLSQEDVERMAASLEADGQINAVVVRPLFLDGDSGGEKTYEIVAGRTRLKAARQLGWEDISAKIDHLTDEQAQVQRVTENLIRSSLKPGEMAKQMKRWEERVAKIAPHRVGKAASGHAAGKAAKRRAEARKREQAEPEEATGNAPPASATPGDEIKGGFDPGPIAPPAEAPEPEAPDGFEEKSLKQEVMERTGLGERAVSRMARVGREFTEEQIDILNDHNVPIKLQEKLALLPDKAARDAAVRKIALEVDPEQAFVEAKAQAGEDVEAGADAMSDEDWFEAECGEVAARLTTEAARNAYRRDALLYRQTREMRRAVRKKLKAALDGLAASVPGGKKGRLFRNFTLFNNPAHPKHWKVCSNCRGSGSVNSATCKECLGDGYRVEMEVAR